MRALALVAALAGCSWNTRDRVLGAAATTFLFADWMQTRTGATPHCLELNPIIGACGERVHPDVYFPLVILGNLVAAELMGSDWRPVALGAMTGAEAATVWANEATP